MKRISRKLTVLILTLVMAFFTGVGTLVAFNGQNMISQPDTNTHPHYIQKLPNDHYLVCRVGFAGPGVFEVDDQGQDVWSYPGIIANSAQRLANGNTLIADSGVPGYPKVPRVIEIDKNNKIVWEYDLPNLSQAPRYATRLANGNTLITLPYEVREVNSSKKVVWQYGSGQPGILGSLSSLSNPVQANRLANGNTLVVDEGILLGRVFELNPQNQVVWQYRGDSGHGQVIGMQKPKSATRLANGNTIIVDRKNDWVIEVNPQQIAERNYSWHQTSKDLSVLHAWYGECLSDGELLLSFTQTSYRGVIVDTNIANLTKTFDSALNAQPQSQPETPTTPTLTETDTK